MYPATPGAKTGGASQDAANLMVGRCAVLRGKITDLMASGYHLTADEIAKQLGESEFAIRPRCTELVKTKVLVKTALRRPNKSGMTAHVLRHRDAGEHPVALPTDEPKSKPRKAAAPAIHTDQNFLFG